MGRGAVVISMLGTKTPVAGLPKGAFFDPMTRIILAALETIGELELGSLASLAKYRTALQIVVSLFYIGWTLSGENAWDPIIMGWKKESGRGGGMSGEEVLLEASANSTRGEALLYNK